MSRSSELGLLGQLALRAGLERGFREAFLAQARAAEGKHRTHYVRMAREAHHHYVNFVRRALELQQRDELKPLGGGPLHPEAVCH